MKLISLSERVNQCWEKSDKDRFQLKHPYFKEFDLIKKYNDFLNTDLLSNYFVEDKEYHYLNRFVPCTIEGFVLDKPFNPAYMDKEDDMCNPHALEMIRSWDNYQNRLSKVMFEGFEYKNNDFNYFMIYFKGESVQLENDPFLGYYKTISNLIDLNLTLTPYGAKIAGL